jgi:hypothetical protein
MAELIENEEVGEIEAVEAEIESKPVVEDVPEKYRGKSVADVVRMHQEAERMIGKQAQEVGEVRKLADDLLRQELAKKAEVKQPEVDFFENPQEAIRREIAANPDLLQAKQYAVQVKQEQAKAMMLQKHPDAYQVIQDASFQEYVNASPVRKRLLQQADAYDLDAADELLSTYKELKAVKAAQVTQIDIEARRKSLSAVSVDTSGTGETSKKMYRSADLIRLRIRDPQKYESMADEIFAAYQEGRVK